ncbi:MAG: cupin domain-containing protein [Phycisphaerales bacterium]|nr:MAG: cupin domain-containing protein [Phycisphaerales bacterium]
MGADTHAKCYRWDDLPEDHPLEKLARRRIVGEKVMIAQVRLQKGCRVPTHAHANEQFAYLVTGRMRFGIGAENSADRHELTLSGGEVLHFPPDVPHSAEALEDSLVLDIFSPPSEKTGVDRGAH